MLTMLFNKNQKGIKMFDENYYKELRQDIENAYNQEMRKQRQKQANLSYNSLGTEHLVPKEYCPAAISCAICPKWKCCK